MSSTDARRMICGAVCFQAGVFLAFKDLITFRPILIARMPAQPCSCSSKAKTPMLPFGFSLSARSNGFTKDHEFLKFRRRVGSIDHD